MDTWRLWYNTSESLRLTGKELDGACPKDRELPDSYAHVDVLLRAFPLRGEELSLHRRSMEGELMISHGQVSEGFHGIP